MWGSLAEHRTNLALLAAQLKYDSGHTQQHERMLEKDSEFILGFLAESLRWSLDTQGTHS